MGIPEEELAARLTNRSFMRYMHYASRWTLPARRLQMQLAQAAYWSSRAAGVTGLTLEDFLFDPPPQDEQKEADPDEAKAFFKFNPRPKNNG